MHSTDINRYGQISVINPVMSKGFPRGVETRMPQGWESVLTIKVMFPKSPPKVEIKEEVGVKLANNGSAALER